MYRQLHRARSGALLDRRTLIECVVLSMLLHLWIVVLFGTATYSGARRDRDFGDVFNVTLRALTGEPGPGFRLAPGVDTVSPGTALLPRARGVAPAPRGRDLARPPEAPSPQTPTEPSARDNVPSAPQEALPPTAAPPMAPPVAEPLPHLNFDAPDVVDKPYVPAPPPPPIEREPAPAAETKTPDAPPPPPMVTKPQEMPAPPPVERVVPPTIEREIAPPPEAKPRVVPITPATPLESAPAPKIEAEPAPPVAPPPRIAPPEPVVRPEPVVPSAPRELAPPAAPATEPARAPAPRNVPSEAAPRPAQRVAPERAPDLRPPARPESAPAESPPRLRFGAPEPDDDMFKPRSDVVTPATEPGAAPRIDLDEAKKRAARAVVREGSGSRGLLPIVPPPPERESKEARALEKAAKPDCRTAYANMGLLAAVPLVASAMGDSGCRW